METGDVLAPGSADASVRPARPGDTRAMGAVQLRSWRRGYTGLLPGSVLDGLTTQQFTDGWGRAVTSPPSARYTVLVACSGPTVVGLGALAPSADGDASPTDADVVALEVDPAHQRAGHGSRLLSAVADRARDHGFTALRVWVPAADDVRRTFLESAGLHPDGAERRLRCAPPDEVEIREIRLSAAL